jgi:hypothetical protein
VCEILLTGFLALYGLTLVIWLVGSFGWFGAGSDPFSAVFLVILGLPWTRWVDLLPEALWPVAGAH